MANYLKTNLKYLRKAKGITQEMLGNQVGKGRTTINNWESGVSTPSVDEVDILAKMLDVSGSDLLYRDLQGVQVTEIQKSGKIWENVQGNVQETVQVKGKDRSFQGDPGPPDQAQEYTYSELKKLNEVLSIAVRGLERANSILERDLDELKEENRVLKKGTPTINGGMDNNAQRATG